MGADHGHRSNGAATFMDRPGMQFQIRILENFYCSIVRPLAPSVAPTVLWISQLNSTSPSSPRFVAGALVFHFCGPPEAFTVTDNLPYIFSTSVASEIVKIHLLQVGVFAMNGIIFHLHPDYHSVARDVISSAGGNLLGHKFKFKIRKRFGAQQRPTVGAHLPDAPAQLEGMTIEVVDCQSDDFGDLSKNGPAKITLSGRALNASSSPGFDSSAASQPPPLSSQTTVLTSDFDKSAYSPCITVDVEQIGRHLTRSLPQHRTRPSFAGGGAAMQTAGARRGVTALP